MLGKGEECGKLVFVALCTNLILTQAEAAAVSGSGGPDDRFLIPRLQSESLRSFFWASRTSEAEMGRRTL